MGNFWKYNDRVSTGAGVTGLDTADGGDAIGDNEIIRGDGTTGIQGGVLTSADHNGDITGPTTGSDTTAVGIAYTNQPSNDSVQILSSDAGDVAVDITIIGTTTGTDTVVVEVLATDATDGTTPVTSVKVDWGQILAIKKPVTTGTITIQKTTGPATVTTLLAAATSSGVAAASNTANAWNRTLSLVGSGATTKQVGIKGTNSSGTTIYDSQALTGTTAVASNSSFVEVHEFYIGDLEGTRTLTASTQGRTKVDGNFVIGGSTGATDRSVLISNGTGGSTVQSLGSLLTVDANGTITSSTTTATSGHTLVLTSAGDNLVPLTAGNNGYAAIRLNYASTFQKWLFGLLKTSDFSGAAGDFSFYNSDATAGIRFLIRDTTGEVSVGSGSAYNFSSTASADGAADTGLVRSSAGVVKVTNGGSGLGSLYGSVVGSITANGASTNIKTSATTVNLSGATSTATGLFPAKCIQLGVTVRVTTLAASGDGGTSMNIGDGSDADRYGATIAFAAGTTVNLTDATADPRGWLASAGDVVFTCVGGTFNAGVVRVVAHYIDLTAPTS